MLLIIRVSKKKNSCLPHGCQESMEIITKKIKKPIGNSCLPHGCQENVSKKVAPKNGSCLLHSCHEPICLKTNLIKMKKRNLPVSRRFGCKIIHQKQ